MLRFKNTPADTITSNNVCSCARVEQPTSFRHSQCSVQGLKKAIGDAVTKHVTVGQATSVNQLKVMSATPTELRLLQVERAAGMGFNISNHTARGKKTTLAVFEQKLTTEFLNWGQYKSVHIMGAVAEAISKTQLCNVFKRAGRFGFWCPLLGAESDSCGENSGWKGPTSRQVRVHFGKSGYSSGKE